MKVYRETYTSNEKPRTCNNEIGHTSFSHPRPRLTSQILKVLHVSVKLLAVALRCLVTLNPNQLNKLILIAIAIPEYNTVGV